METSLSEMADAQYSRASSKTDPIDSQLKRSDLMADQYQVRQITQHSSSLDDLMLSNSIGRLKYEAQTQLKSRPTINTNKTKLHRPHYDHQHVRNLNHRQQCQSNDQNHHQLCDTARRVSKSCNTLLKRGHHITRKDGTVLPEKCHHKETLSNTHMKQKLATQNSGDHSKSSSGHSYSFKKKVDLLSKRTNDFYLLYTTYAVLSLICSLAPTPTTDCLLIRVRSRDELDNRTTMQPGTTNLARSSSSTSLQPHLESQLSPNSTSRSAKLLEVDAFGYLQRYGYVNESMGNANLISEDAFSEAIMTFQRFAGIAETGTIDNETIKYMQMPRCGNKDMSGKGENGKRKRRRRKRYALQGSKWRRQELTYRISQYPTKFLNKKYEVDKQIERAFKIWSQVAPIDFVVKLDGRVHIDIRFASGEHGDGDPFDGPGNTLAHAYFPQYGGDAHFDDQEYWTVDSYAGTNIFQVAAHELGHSLGLGHSSVREALMAPFYQKYKPNFKLHPDDILGIQALYGERSDGDSSGSSSTSTTTTTTTSTTASPDDGESQPSPPRRPSGSGGDSDSDGWFGFGGSGSSKPVDLCHDSAIDAITRTEDGNTYVFRGAYYWQIKNEGLASGFPAKISRDWDGLPSNLDAALTWSDGKTFFFKGDKYWRYFNKRREPGYPKQISVGFAGIPNNVDAAFVWGGNGKTYFFKRDKYWRFDSKQDPPVSSQYPKSIRNWGGLPTTGIDGAFKWENGMTYFFKDDLYYRFDDREFEVDSSARPAFPRSTAEWWFGCTNSNLPLKNRPNMPTTNNNNYHHSASQTMAQPTGSLSSSTSSISELDDQLAIGPSIKPRGSSLSRSILNSLSSLFPSSSSAASLASSTSSSESGDSARSSLFDDWSFHRGLGEEVNRVFRAVGRSSNNNNKPSSISLNGMAGGPHKIESALLDNSRWTFPLDSSSRRFRGLNREESLSELKLSSSNQGDNDSEKLTEINAATDDNISAQPSHSSVLSEKEVRNKSSADKFHN